MKNLLIYVAPEKQFNEEVQRTVKVQIDNSLSLGWRKEDIIVATNFDYEYNGVKSTIVSDESFCSFLPPNTKQSVIIELFEKGFIDDEVYWYHDFDCFQCEPYSLDDLFLNNKADIAMADYGQYPRWNAGSIFFKKSTMDIFMEVKSLTYKFELSDELALGFLTDGYDKTEAPWDGRTGEYRYPGKLSAPIYPLMGGDRVSKLNISYNFIFLWRLYRIKKLYDMAIKPIKAVHFHPCCYSYKHLNIPNIMDFYMGNNEANAMLLSENLIEVFRHHKMI